MTTDTTTLLTDDEIRGLAEAMEHRPWGVGSHRKNAEAFGRRIEAAVIARMSAAPAGPIDMVLHCPACGLQHIDAPEHTRQKLAPGITGEPWENPLHRSHLCHGCGHIWRPADVPTNGVEAVKTKGQADSPIIARMSATAAMPVAWFVRRNAPGKRDDGRRLGPFWKRTDAEEWCDDAHTLHALYAAPAAPETAGQAPAPAPDTSEREAFEAKFCHFDLTQIGDAWGRPIYKHQRVRDLWQAWQAHAALAASQRTGGGA